jgi:cytochrome b-561
MASTTIPPDVPTSDAERQTTAPNGREVADDEMEPLLGRRGDVLQVEGSNMTRNLFLGTAVLAQFGIWLLAIYIWSIIFSRPFNLFSYHPLLQSLSLLILTQAILVLQPTHTPDQKRTGQRVHAALVASAITAAAGGIAVIEYNKISGGRAHFHAVHGYLGVTSGIVMGVQVLVGITMWAVPALYGGEAQAKAVWKYHRWSGYTILVLLLSTVASATKTDYNDAVLKIPLWVPVVLSVLVVVGTFPRIKKQKMGLGVRQQ